ncbi:hypothetical protein D0907_18720 (plasmid) [Pseudoalteromonas lipolytica]|uniref:Uncharacterized protein n=1 Tax=Pseudoalteromonas lipolytica TaxID=570156 RepID=A0AAD0WEC4_9GAMM|nr:hypothetical protein [Pseudoalteromonas donghaensis]AXV67343.1 hypothetical protein D0907_18720 [Pseudoalteromonas donghaensis]
MKVEPTKEIGTYDLGIFGLGYESRSTHIISKIRAEKLICLGYESNTDKCSYQDNKVIFSEKKSVIYEGKDETVLKNLESEISTFKGQEINCIVDITVMTRHRLAEVICMLINSLGRGSTITISYSLSCYVEPPEGLQPSSKVCEISSELTGKIGDLCLPTSLVLGLGYEEGKALGVVNYLDSEYVFYFIPRGSDNRFDEEVIRKNENLLKDIHSKSLNYYEVSNPVICYRRLKELICSLQTSTRPLLMPLGPKIFAAISTVLGKELYPNLPVWRVSSEHQETPVERHASGEMISFTISL